jgi:hypothetical protein
MLPPAASHLSTIAPLCPPLKQAPIATKTSAPMKKKATTIPKAKKVTTSSTRSNSNASRPQGLPKPRLRAMEVEAQAHQHAIHTDFQSLLDSETATEDDGLDLFDEAPRYNTTHKTQGHTCLPTNNSTDFFLDDKGETHIHQYNMILICVRYQECLTHNVILISLLNNNVWMGCE